MSCLHFLSVIHIMGQTLAPFDDDNLIPVYGFGDVTTTDKRVFPFFPDRYKKKILSHFLKLICLFLSSSPCNGFEEALQRYNEITPYVTLAGPTSFAPIIRETIRIVQQTRSVCELHLFEFFSESE